MAKNAKLTIVEVRSVKRVLYLNLRVFSCQAENIVPVGSISPNAIHLPGIYVNRIVQATTEKDVEIQTLAQPTSDSSGGNGLAAQDIRHRIARRAAKELKNGFHVNLGIGMPTLVPEHLPPDVKVWLQSENGILGMGPYPTEKQLDACVPLSLDCFCTC